eukprot:6207294-Pleurochrysis_carterae.AAC.1
MRESGSTLRTAPMPWPQPQMSRHAFLVSGPLPVPKSICDGSLCARKEKTKARGGRRAREGVKGIKGVYVSGKLHAEGREVDGFSEWVRL